MESKNKKINVLGMFVIASVLVVSMGIPAVSAYWGYPGCGTPCSGFSYTDNVISVNDLGHFVSGNRFIGLDEIGFTTANSLIGINGDEFVSTESAIALTANEFLHSDRSILVDPFGFASTERFIALDPYGFEHAIQSIIVDDFGFSQMNRVIQL